MSATYIPPSGGSMSGAAIVSAIDTELGSDTWQGGSGAGVDTTVTSLALLAAVATTGITPGDAASVKVWVLASDGSFQVWQLRASTAATGEGVQRPDDYAGTTNEKVWFKCN